MGTRGPVKTLGSPVLVRFGPRLDVQLRILSALEGRSRASLIRILLKEALRARGPIPPLEGPIMSRQIDTTPPLSPEDEQYLATRGITAEKLAERQATYNLLVDARAAEDDKLIYLIAHKIAEVRG